MNNTISPKSDGQPNQDNPDRRGMIELRKLIHREGGACVGLALERLRLDNAAALLHAQALGLMR